MDTPYERQRFVAQINQFSREIRLVNKRSTTAHSLMRLSKYIASARKQAHTCKKLRLDCRQLLNAEVAVARIPPV